MIRSVFVAVSAGVISVPALGVVFPESEPNSMKSTADIVAGMNPGDSIIGSSQGGNSFPASNIATADYFRVSTAAAPLAIYRHRLSMISQDNTTDAVLRHEGTIRGDSGGFDEIASYDNPGAAENQLVNTWYGFGRSEQIVYRVAGISFSGNMTTSYASTLQSEVVTPVAHGDRQAGPVTITAGSSADGSAANCGIALYDSSLLRIAYADTFVSGGPNAILTETLAEGVYYFALAPHLVDNQSDNPRLDFPDGVVNALASNTGIDFSINIADGASSASAVGFTEASGIYWGTFTVVPAPSVGLSIALASGVLARRRRR